MDNMIEAKLDIFRKQQENITKVGFSIQHNDIPDYLAAAALGKRYYLVLVDADDYDERDGVVRENRITEQSEGDKLRVRAVLLCKDKQFQRFIGGYITSPAGDPTESECAYFMKKSCNIKSRSELSFNLDAQALFKQLDEKFKTWQIEQQYKDNLDRI